MAPTKFKPGLTETEIENLHPLIKRFITTLEEKFGKDGFVITSAFRKGAKTKSGRLSRHGGVETKDLGEAIDFRPTQKLYDYLYNTEEGLKLMLNHGLGFLDERSKEQQENFGATAANLHIGMDSTAVNPTKERLDKMLLPSDDPKSISSLDPDLILSQTVDNYRSDIIDRYEKEKKAISNDKGLLKSEGKQKLRDLNRKFFLSNELGIVNKKIGSENQKIVDDRKEAIKDFEDFNSLGGMVFGTLDKVEIEELDTSRRTKFDQNLKDISELGDDKIKKQTTSREPAKAYRLKNVSEPYIKKLIEKLPDDQKNIISKDKNGYIIRYAENFRKFVDHANKEYEDITGKKLFYPTVFNERSNSVYDFKEDIQGRKADFDLTEDDLTPLILPDVDFDPTPAEDELPKGSEGKDGSKTNKTKQEKFDLSVSDKVIADQFGEFQDKEKIETKEVFDYDKKNFNQQLPFEALAFGALALKGLSDADIELPLRNEQVSDAIINYMRENRKISELGLKPEEEAAMKTQIADAYQEGITRLTRASGGNRNLVLGNLSGLNRNRLQGILAVSIADIEAKTKGWEEYGQTLQYIENFNTTREIANHQIKLGEALETRKAGEDLANAGFAAMVNEIQFQRENGPGSANHRFKAQMEYNIFGVATGMKDDGTGKVGTASGLKRQQANIEKHNLEIDKENALKRSNAESDQIDFYKNFTEKQISEMSEFQVKKWFLNKRASRSGSGSTGIANPFSIKKENLQTSQVTNASDNVTTPVKNSFDPSNFNSVLGNDGNKTLYPKDISGIKKGENPYFNNILNPDGTKKEFNIDPFNMIPKQTPWEDLTEKQQNAFAEQYAQ